MVVWSQKKNVGPKKLFIQTAFQDIEVETLNYSLLKFFYLPEFQSSVFKQKSDSLSVSGCVYNLNIMRIIIFSQSSDIRLTKQVTRNKS